MIKFSMALSTFLVLGFTQLTFAADDVLPLKPGRYETESQFCPQQISWDGPMLVLLAVDDCDAKIVLQQVSEGVYQGKAEDYEYDYRVTVKDSEHYNFESIDFETNGDFYYEGSDAPKRIIQTSQSMDPTQR